MVVLLIVLTFAVMVLIDHLSLRQPVVIAAAEPESAATAETASTESTDATRKTRVGSRSARRSAPVVPSRPSTRGRDRAKGEDDVDVGF